MNGYGIITILILPAILVGVVYMGMNAEEYTGGFGEPSYISSQFTPPSNDLPPFSLPSFSLPSFSSPSFSFSSFPLPSSSGSSGGINLDKMQAEIENRISNANSPQEIEQIIEDFAHEVMSDPRLQKECEKVVKEFKKEQAKAMAWVESGKDLYSYPQDKILQITKEVQHCGFAAQAGYITLNP